MNKSHNSIKATEEIRKEDTSKVKGILESFLDQSTPSTNTNLDVENPYELGGPINDPSSGHEQKYTPTITMTIYTSCSNITPWSRCCIYSCTNTTTI